ncbi:DUF3578 domain-containing protein [Paenibacillus woosongensis]|uniref:DUF3578 domain-containing protein n=1 Tax=Paenibacillus woosongensis TaxID=307580 RepID=A0AA95KW83_9BACL|nr:DUF3578 domain-containing protein [Paenibacillus woosongensis]WHX49375.1 DUF3578 domain-containing protein [Paenibacillus woosongensis]
MSLPTELASIFRVKQKSYKMVLVLSMIGIWRETQQRFISLDSIAERFLSYCRDREVNNLVVDIPPNSMASRWSEVSATQVKAILDTPIDALRSILAKNDRNELTFTYAIWDGGEEVLTELERYANRELEAYYTQLQSNSFSLKEHLSQILLTYRTAKQEPFANHPLGTAFRRTIPEGIRQYPFISDHIRVQGSVGQGNWATVPWIALMDTRLTGSTQYGEYLVYLFAEDMSSVYLTFNQGVTKPIRDHGRRAGYTYLENKVDQIRKQLPLVGFTKDDRIELTTSGLGHDYQVSTVAYVRYDSNNLPENEQLVADLQRMMEDYQVYVQSQLQTAHEEVDDQIEDEESEEVETLSVTERLSQIRSFIQNRGFSYPDGLIENFYLSIKTKPFVILAGISGTGKTKLVKLFAEAMGATVQNGQFALIPVRPDWSDPSDLLGYKDLSGTFRPGRLTEVLYEASKPENRSKPYFICLDEMNLARVEHYFSDLLSVLETQEWRDDEIATAPLISAASLSSEEDQQKYGDLSIPDNVYFMGTVNMDETTHPFSKKVLDRANTIEFNYINLLQLPDEVRGETITEAVAPNSFLRSDFLQLVDALHENRELISETTQSLAQLNEILEGIHAHVGFRVRDSVSFYMIYNRRDNLMSADEAFDLQLLQKILPRIQGSSSAVRRVLLELLKVCLDRPLAINELMEDLSPVYNEAELLNTQSQIKYPQSARKIVFMLRRLEEDGFTSYWLS